MPHLFESHLVRGGFYDVSALYCILICPYIEREALVELNAQARRWLYQVISHRMAADLSGKQGKVAKAAASLEMQKAEVALDSLCVHAKASRAVMGPYVDRIGKEFVGIFLRAVIARNLESDQAREFMDFCENEFGMSNTEAARLIAPS